MIVVPMPAAMVLPMAIDSSFSFNLLSIFFSYTAVRIRSDIDDAHWDVLEQEQSAYDYQMVLTAY